MVGVSSSTLQYMYLCIGFYFGIFIYPHGHLPVVTGACGGSLTFIACTLYVSLQCSFAEIDWLKFYVICLKKKKDLDPIEEFLKHTVKVCAFIWVLLMPSLLDCHSVFGYSKVGHVN